MSPWNAEDLRLIEEAEAERLEGRLAPGERLAVEGGDGADGAVYARFVLQGGPSSERLELEATVPRQDGLDADAARDLALDALDLLVLEYLESERQLRFAGVAEGRELRGFAVQVRGERTFPALEAQADALLSRDRS